MGKPVSPRRLDETEAHACLRGLRTSPRKLNLVAETIRGKTADSALAALTFSHRRIAHEVKKVLQAAIANAENNHQLDVDRLYIRRLPSVVLSCLSGFTPAVEAGRHGWRSISRTLRSLSASAQRSVTDGSKSQSDRTSARHQPDLGLALVRAQGIRQHAAR